MKYKRAALIKIIPVDASQKISSTDFVKKQLPPFSKIKP